MIHLTAAAAMLRRSWLALVPVLLASASATAIAIPPPAGPTQINDDLLPPAPVVSGQSYDPTSQPEGPAGVFSFVATVCNNNGAAALAGGLQSRTATLSGGNAVVNRDADPVSVGSVVWFPATGQYADRSLGQGECVAVPYQIGLQQRKRFQFFVDFEQVPVATCSQCVDLDCLLTPTVSLCDNDQDVCTITVVDTTSRSIVRACGIRDIALAAASSNIPGCEDVEDGIISNSTCVFVCDGITHPNCNLPPNLIPSNGRLVP